MKFSEIHIEEDCSNVKGVHSDALFFGCAFDNLNDLTLRNCDLNKSKFITDSVHDALGFTLTLDCNSFRDVEFSPLLFDLMLGLLISTAGNDEKRAKLVDVLGADRAEALARVLKRVE